MLFVSRVNAFAHKWDLYKVALIFSIPIITYAFISWSIQAIMYNHLGIYKDIHDSLFVSDSVWYYSIAVNGYAHVPFSTSVAENWAFFPLYPFVTRWISWILPGKHVFAVGVILSVASFFMFLTVLYNWVKGKTSNEIANTVLITGSFVPLMPFFLTYRAGALFMLISTVSLIYMDKKRWATAAIIGALASLTRPVGLLLCVPFVVCVLLDENSSWNKKILRLAYTPLFLSGYIGSALIDLYLSGNPLAFLQIQVDWGRYAAPLFFMWWKWLQHPALLGDWGWSIPVFSMASTIVGVALSVYLILDKRFRHLGVYLLLVAILSNRYTTFQGIPRFVVETPSLYVGLALIFKRYNIRFLLYSASLVTQTLYYALWVLGVHAVQT